MKCGILTINVNLMNYGNRLQNYALQTVLESMGVEVLTVKYHPTYEARSVQSLKSRVAKLPKRIIFGSYRRVIRLFKYFQICHKKEKFRNFINNYIKWTNKDYDIYSDFSALPDEFDYMIAGSDQIWNPYWEGTNPIYFMEFMPQDRRISYAASFGVSHIPNEKKEYFRQNLQGIPFLSVREDSGAKIVNDLIGREPLQVIDPVFLLARKEWRNIARMPKRMNGKKYLLVYLLGDCEKVTTTYIKKYAKDNKLDILYLDRYDKWPSFFASPNEFVGLIMNADTILTDSFHGVAFSIIFHKKIIYWNRSLNNGINQDMSSRLASIFKLFGYIQRDEELNCQYCVFMNFDGNSIDKKIEIERQKSLAYLRAALNLEPDYDCSISDYRKG